MTDDALKRAYRQLSAGQLSAEGRVVAAAPIAADTLAALSNADYAEAERDANLAAVAESAQNADLLRALRALADDAVALSAEVQALRGQSPRRSTQTPPPAVRPARWYALAASVAVVGVVGLVFKATMSIDAAPVESSIANGAADLPASSVSAMAGSGKIMLASFEESAVVIEAESSKPTIFVGDFDS